MKKRKYIFETLIIHLLIQSCKKILFLPCVTITVVYMYDSIISYCKASQKKGGNGSVEMEESNETTSQMSQSDEYIKTVHEFSNVLVFVCKL